jgi:hypothetical protein
VELSALSMEGGPYHAVRIGGSKTPVSSEDARNATSHSPPASAWGYGPRANDETVSNGFSTHVKSQLGREVTENQSGKLLQLRFVKLN